MNIFSTMTISLISICSYGQKYPKTYEPYKADNGYEFKVGDTIYITEPAGFKEEFTAVFDNKPLTNREEALYIYTNSDGKKVIYDNRYDAYKIRNFINHPNGFIVAALDSGLGGIFKTFVAIDQAIESDEIANCNSLYHKSIWGTKTFISDSIAYIQYLAREPEISKDLAKEYLYLFNRANYNMIREDEFEFHKGIKETQRQLNEIVSNTETNTIYSILFDDWVENYDFDLEVFPIKWEHNGGQIYNDLWEIWTPDDINKDGVKLTDLRIRFINTDYFDKLPLDIKKANSFIKYKKDDSGNVDRKIFMKISFQIVGLSKREEITRSYFKGEKYLQAEIQSIDFFANGSKRYINYYHYWLNRIEK